MARMINKEPTEECQDGGSSEERIPKHENMPSAKEEKPSEELTLLSFVDMPTQKLDRDFMVPDLMFTRNATNLSSNHSRRVPDSKECVFTRHALDRVTRLKHGPNSGKKKQHKHKLFGPNILRTFLTLTPECPGVKKFLPTTGATGKRTFWCGRPRFAARTSMTRRVVEKLCTEEVCVDFLAPTNRQ